ncbi:metal transporter CNNM4 [Pogona vitticeps]
MKIFLFLLTFPLLASASSNNTVIIGMKLENSTKPGAANLENDIVQVVEGSRIHLRIYGRGINEFIWQAVYFGEMLASETTSGVPHKDACWEKTSDLRVLPYALKVRGRTAVLPVIVQTLRKEIHHKDYVLCVADNPEQPQHEHRDHDLFLRVVKEEKLGLPLELRIILLMVYLGLSGIFSGLSVGLMSLNPQELRILQNAGTDKEKRYASRILPLREKGNYLLCSLLIANVLVNNCFSISFDFLVGASVVAIGISTFAIVLLGGIIPQALCCRHGLAMSAKTTFITRLVMWLTYPVSYPLSKILDRIFGKEIGTAYTREKLLDMLRVTQPSTGLGNEELNIIKGALELSTKTVEDVRTPLPDCFLINTEATLDFDTMTDILKSGYTRIPVYSGKNRTNIVDMLFVKDLAFVDPDDCTPLRTITKFHKHPVHYISNTTSLGAALEEFKKGKSHLAVVQKMAEDERPCEALGVVTLEDVIEEIINSEIIDESDIYTDNRTKRRVSSRREWDFSVFKGNYGAKISPQLLLAAHRFLSAEVSPFSPDLLSEKYLQHLLHQRDVVCELRFNEDQKDSPHHYLYENSKEADYFILILKGKVEVEAEAYNDKMKFENGPFSYYGAMALGSPFSAGNL